MHRPIAMARYDLAWPLAGVLAFGLSMLVLGVLSLMNGLPFWMPLNATTHTFYGPNAADFTGFDLAHTGLGAIINLAACFFWAAVTVFTVRGARKGRIGMAWLAGLGTALVAGVVDYALLPEFLRPGWELVLSPYAVAGGFLALGVGLSLGLIAAQRIADRNAESARLNAELGAVTDMITPTDHLVRSALDRRRHPSPHVIDQRQQRIDPANRVTDDLNLLQDNNKQPVVTARNERLKS
ncbi:hypothetical protein [Paracoccus pacificus]|uniref:DUF998 domain-containing protein n=1 Tax=Paracoccus pacificus TaxID=1463598 RepID=A0ABW4R4G8_9RHOB